MIPWYDKSEETFKNETKTIYTKKPPQVKIEVYIGFKGDKMICMACVHSELFLYSIANHSDIT